MKKITMKNSFVSSWSRVVAIGSIASLALLTACGDDVTNESVLKAQSYETKADLPACDEKYEGKFATIPSKKEVYVCSEGEWNSLLSKPTVSDDGEFACSTEALSNGKGYKVVCGGDSVAVLTNGAKGATGDKGPVGASGESGQNGKPGTNGSSGRDLTLGEGDCAVFNSGNGYVVYDCSDSTYVRNRSGANFYTWNAIESAKESDYGDPWSYDNSKWLGHWSGLYNDRFGAKATGSMKRWEDDKTWKNGEAWNLGLVADFYAYEGNALLTLTEDVETSVADYRPYVGIRLAFGSMDASDYGGTAGDAQATYRGSYDVSFWGGVCLTYRSETEMNILLKNGAKFVMASVPASGNVDATVNIKASDFAALEGAGYTAKEVVQSVDTVTVELLGSNEKGEYTNNFAIYEFGAYNRCAGYTKNIASDLIKAGNGGEGSFKDPRDGKTYATVTIKGKVWMAQNLDYDYKVHENPLHDGDEEDPDFECDDTHPCVEGLVYEYADQDHANLFGRLYSWAAAIDSASLARAETPLTCGTGTTCTLPANVQGICPPDWRLPSIAEFRELAESACDPVFNRYCLTQEALYSTDGWNSEKDAGENWLGISLYPSGWYNFETSSEGQVGSGAYYWTASESSVTSAYYHDGWWYSTIAKQRAQAVRCIQDEAK